MTSWFEVLLAVLLAALDEPQGRSLSRGYRLPLATSVFAMASAISAPVPGLASGFASSPVLVLHLDHRRSEDSVVLDCVLGRHRPNVI